MKKQMVFIALVLAFLTLEAQEAIPGQYIVVLRESAAKPVVKQQKSNNNREAKERANKPARDQVLARLKAVRGKGKIKESAVIMEYADVLSGFVAKLSPQEKKALESDPDVEGVYQDYSETLGTLQAETGVEQVTAASQHVNCAITKAGGPASGAAKATWIWILDSGIDLDHPDLSVITSPTYAKSFISGQTVDDGYGHGTHMAGVAAAKNNSFGVVGVSAGARVVPVKVLSNSGTGSWSGLIAGLNHIAKYDIPNDVVLISLGSYGFSNCENSNPVLRDAIRNLGLAGTHVVMPAGSNGGDAGRALPGCINGTRIYTVGSITCENTCASFSNWGIPIDWVAVGTVVTSTYKNGGYVTWSGTAISAAVVAGVIHARSGAPASGGTVNCGGRNYKIARI